MKKIKMIIVDYKLKSLPGRDMFIPKENAEKAEGLVKAIVNAKTSGELFFNVIYNELRIDGSPYSNDKDLLPRAMDLMFSEKGSPESLKLDDNVYIRAFRCLYMKENGSKKDKDKIGTLNIANHFIDVLELKD